MQMRPPHPPASLPTEIEPSYITHTPDIDPRHFRRTFFGIFQEAPRRIRTNEFEPGWPLVLSWRTRVLENLRPPVREELVDAFRQLFQHKLEFGAPVNSTQALQCYRLFTYLLTAARDALLLVPKDNLKNHLDFSRALYHEIVRQRQLESQFGVPEEEPEVLVREDTGNRWPTTQTYAAIIKFSRRTGLQDWVNEAFKALIDHNPRKAHWDVIFQWAVFCRDEGVEGVKHMIDIMVKNNPENESARPDIDTINGLIRTAMEKNDPYLAERFLALASELGISPNSTTYILQMDYRIDAKDLSGAKAAYQDILRTEIQDDEDLAVINKYIRALCGLERPLLKSIHETMANLEHRLVTLDPETVVALCMAFLKNDDQYDVIDTLAVHVFHYSSEQREQIRSAFVEFILEEKNSTSRVWDAYQLLMQFFPETTRGCRVKVMGAFFDRKRADMATGVFMHMKEHVNRDFRPTVDEYVVMLEGLGQVPDEASLESVHNMLKIDTNVQSCTKLSNALMIALGACGRSLRALDIWHDISRSAEGPSYASLEIIFAVLEKKPFGDEDAKAIWRSMERMELEIPPSVFAAYCGSLAGNARLDEVKSLIKGMSRTVGYDPDSMILGVAHNALRSPKLQADFQAWALSQYPDLWAELERLGRRRTEGYLSVFKISRNLKA
ncbi:unnamed protein product [Parascedosporium putredinis]|uniref:Complex I intermediate-associated protein 84 n=1 Tax=Parascedosporium putredinis TaxID=1442378 RepID=A0A9P1MBD5_9PEZI|nr:unnamed protein product [Parascedosporium putredinis]CAI7995717.1 unnamed protein product [Parascedosporium putredinis]